MPNPPTRWKLSHVCVLVFALSFFAIAMNPEARLTGLEVPTIGEAVRVARSLADHGTFANPFALVDTGPTAHVAPVYPFIYAAFLKVFGTGYAGLLVLWAANIGFLALQMALLPWLTSRLRFGMTPGIIAAALGSFSVHAQVDASWECFLAGLLLMIVFILTWRVANWATFPRAIILGVVWGVLVLTNPVMVLLLIAWPLVVIASNSCQHRAVIGNRALTMFCAAMLTIAPWILRDYIQFGAFIFVRDNLGLELSIGNSPCATPTLSEIERSGCFYATHPGFNPAIAKNVATVGELAFERARLHEALNWINSNRSAFLKLTAQRFRQFWFPTLDRRWQEFIVWPITLLSLTGIFILWRKNAPLAGVILITWILFPAIYYFVPAETRYRYPIYWTMLLPAGCAAKLFADKFATRYVPAIFGETYRQPVNSEHIR